MTPFQKYAGLGGSVDACPTGDQEVAGFNAPPGLATFFHGDLITKYFQWSYSPFP